MKASRNHSQPRPGVCTASLSPTIQANATHNNAALPRARCFPRQGCSQWLEYLHVQQKACSCCICLHVTLSLDHSLSLTITAQIDLLQRKETLPYPRATLEELSEVLSRARFAKYIDREDVHGLTSISRRRKSICGGGLVVWLVSCCWRGVSAPSLSGLIPKRMLAFFRISQHLLRTCQVEDV